MWLGGSVNAQVLPRWFGKRAWQFPRAASRGHESGERHIPASGVAGVRMTMGTNDEVCRSIGCGGARTGSATCVGLDPRKAQLPEPIRAAVQHDLPDQWAAAYTQFCCEIVDVVKDLVPCVKPQAAFFEELGPAGMVALGEVIRYAHAAGLIVITDGKRNDIGSTATAYANAYLGAGSGEPLGKRFLDGQPLSGPR